MSSLPWTNARVESLKRLWADGLSASQIAAQLGGVSRNAVIGKLHRLGAAGRAQPSAPRAGKRVCRSADQHVPRRAAREPQPVRAPSVRHVPPGVSVAELPALVGDLAGLGAGACHWPIGDPKSAAFGFCGRPCERGPYCASHASRAFRPAGRPLGRDPVLRRLLASAFG